MSTQELYQGMVLEHGKNPRNFGEVKGYTHIAQGKNPVCGDHLVLMLRVENEEIEDIGFMGDGCAISKASASLLTSFLKGKSIPEAENILKEYASLLHGDFSGEAELGKLKVFEGVTKFPSRVKCAALALRATESALHRGEEVKTE